MFLGGLDTITVTRREQKDLLRVGHTHTRVSSTAAPVMEDAKELLWSGLSSCRVHSSIVSFLYICSSASWTWDDLNASERWTRTWTVRFHRCGMYFRMKTKSSSITCHLLRYPRRLDLHSRPQQTDWRVLAISQHTVGLTAGPFFYFSCWPLFLSPLFLRIWFTVLTATSITQSRVVFTSPHPPTPLTFQLLNNLFLCVWGRKRLIFSLLFKKWR